MRAFGLMRDERGFTSIGMAVALLVSLSLVFSSAQVYRVSSASADVQDVADAAALAAENEVAEFMTIVRVCDAVVLSLSLTGVVASGVGVALLCVPGAMAVAEELLSLGSNLFEARDSFSRKAKSTLNELQRALPFMAAANAASVAASNEDASGSGYMAVAFLSPDEGEVLDVSLSEGVEGFRGALVESKDDIAHAAAQAEEIAREAEEIKARAFARDCGDAPAYCMYERADALAGLSPSGNPLYRSVDAWSFEAALKRAQAYYPQRLAQEAPADSSTAERARSALRERFYRYAANEVARGYVRDDGDAFDAYFPLLPGNTEEMRETSLYTEDVYPISESESGLTMHAWEGCPAVGSIVSRGSVRDMETEGFATCPTCGFCASSLGSVAAASTSIENGFEYHYDAVARAAAEYENARERIKPFKDAAKTGAQSLIDQLASIGRAAASARIDACPPGSLGATVLAVNLGSMPAQTGFESLFVRQGQSLGARAAVSAATLVADPSGEEGSVIASLLDGIAVRGGAATGIAGIVLDGWSDLLHAYAKGQQAVGDAFERVAGSVPLASASGLGAWAADAFRATMSALGLEPAQLDALRPVAVNSSHVAHADEASAFSARLLSAKNAALSLSGPSGDVFSSIATSVEQSAFDALEQAGAGVEIATIRPLGEGGPSVPITVSLPPAVLNGASGLVDRAMESLRSLYASATGVMAWT